MTYLGYHAASGEWVARATDDSHEGRGRSPEAALMVLADRLKLTVEQQAAEISLGARDG